MTRVDPDRADRRGETEARLAPAHAKQFKENEGAWRFFRAQPPGYQRIGIWWIVSAKREETKQRRLLALIEGSPVEDCRITLPAELIVRATTAAPAETGGD